MTEPDLCSPIPSCASRKDPQGETAFEEASADAEAPSRVQDLFTGRRVHFAFNTRTAIRVACDALRLAPGDEVLVPAYNCGSEVDPLLHAGLSVTIYPVGRDLVADPDAIAKRISSRTRAVYVTHYFGFLQPQLAEIRALCDINGLRLMEDCALSLLSGSRPAAGRIGDVSFFCFHKFFSAPGGSALVINTGDLPSAPTFDRSPLRRTEFKFMARRILGTLIGIDRLRQAKRALRKTSTGQIIQLSGTKQDIPGHYYFDPDLTGRRMSRLVAKTIQRADLDAAIRQRRRNWQIYRELLVRVPEVELLIQELPEDICPQSMPVLIPDRDRIVSDLQAAGVDVTAWWAGFHQGLDWSMAGDAIGLKNSVLSLPLSPGLTRSDLSKIVALLAARLAV
jgi:dTDP-4-amino-4,6-dideoxygalactose transaminase